MPYPNIGAAKKAGFNTKLDGVPLTLPQINDLAKIYDSIKAKGGAEEPMAVAITTFKKKYTKKGNVWVKREAKQEDASSVEMASIKSIEELPGPAQAVWNDVYQIVVKKLKKEGIDMPIAKSRARRAATIHINKYYDHNPDTGKWTKKPKE